MPRVAIGAYLRLLCAMGTAATLVVKSKRKICKMSSHTFYTTNQSCQCFCENDRRRSFSELLCNYCPTMPLPFQGWSNTLTCFDVLEALFRAVKCGILPRVVKNWTGFEIRWRTF